MQGHSIWDIILKTTITFSVLFLLTRLLGKKQLSHLTFFNYVTGITIGSIAANIISNLDKPILEDIIGMVWWYILTAILGYSGLKFNQVRALIDGQPTIVVKKGHIIKNAMKKNRLNMDDLSMLLREHEVFSIAEVDYAILEPDGKLSVLKKPSMQNVIREDMKIQPTDIKYLPSEIIVDGKVVQRNLIELGITENWLMQKLTEQNITSVKDVLYGEIQTDGRLYVQKQTQ